MTGYIRSGLVLKAFPSAGLRLAPILTMSVMRREMLGSLDIQYDTLQPKLMLIEVKN